MTVPAERSAAVVEVRPEVVFLAELLQELTQGRLRIPRFQRPFIWRRDQMTDLLDSVYKQYPIGSMLVWETDQPIATLDRLGPFKFQERGGEPVGYLLDGHQRLSTLAGALVAREEHLTESEGGDPGRWDLVWDMEALRFQHGSAVGAEGRLFPLTSLLDTLRFFRQVDEVRKATRDREGRADSYVENVSRVARSFQYYRVPVVRIKQTGLSEAVEIFARLNSKGQTMSADQMVSALMYRQGESGQFDLASAIDELSEQLSLLHYSDIDRTTVLRAILANLDEDIYRTDWTRLALERREELLPRMRVGVERTARSLLAAVDFLKGLGVRTSRLLPYSTQLVVLSSFLDRRPKPSREQKEFLSKWFWVSSFSGWFGGANPSRVNSLITELRREVAPKQRPVSLSNFDMAAKSLPYPSTFDMRSARTRCLLLVMLSLQPQGLDGQLIAEPWREIAEKGPSAVGRIFYNVPRDVVGNPANRMIRPPGGEQGSLRPWIEGLLNRDAVAVLESHAVDRNAREALANGDAHAFVAARQENLIRREQAFQQTVGVISGGLSAAESPIDTD